MCVCGSQSDGDIMDTTGVVGSTAIPSSSDSDASGPVSEMDIGGGIDLDCHRGGRGRGRRGAKGGRGATTGRRGRGTTAATGGGTGGGFLW